MSRLATSPCPDWRTLSRHRVEPDGVEPLGWPQALEHFDRCPLCRKEAIAADPTLLFRRLAAPAPLSTLGSHASPASSAASTSGGEEIEAMLAGVAALRAASRLAAPRRPHVLHGWQRWAVAAALAVAALSLGTNRLPAGGALRTLAAIPAVADLAAPGVDRIDTAPSGLNVVPAANPSPIEGLNRPDARVYQMDGDHLSVVMIVDESLDV